MYPLSFSEYLDFSRSNKNLEERFLDYMTYGSLPYTTELELNEKNIFEYLNGIFNTVVIKDVVTRNKIKDIQTLYSIIDFLFDNIGNITSSNKIANTLTSNNKKTNAVTVDNYIKALVDSYIIHKVQRYDIKGKEYLRTQEKYYICDIGLRNAILGLRNIDQGRIIENIVYLELLRRGYKISIGKLRDETEIDFIASKQDTKYYIQVAYTVIDKAVLDRELKPLRKIKDSYQKALITMDKSINKDYEGIVNINLLDFLIGDTIIN